MSAPIVVVLDWNLSFKLMYDVSDYATGAILGQKKDITFQLNYATTKKELLAIMFVFDKFRPYLIGNKVIVHIDHSLLRRKRNRDC